MNAPRLDRHRLPHHIAVIMDGNGRWARQRGRPRVFGHRAGSKAVRRVVRACRRLGIEVLSLYAFSAQNWGRPADEVHHLMDLLGEFIIKEWQEIMERGIRVVHIGAIRRVPAEVRSRLKALELASQRNRDMTLVLALSYGGREEIVRGAQRLVSRAAAGKLRPADVDADCFSRALYTAGLPEPELLIRTGGERRISNFLLWQCAYTELFFTDVLWPDFKVADLRAAIIDFQGRSRRFGLTGEQWEERDG
ncbi:MAG: isoprenyl transferase [Deltaproteobacteria bacterium]|nr:isoprenyl transferase [Deltaproteobacteria bacterium]